MPDLGTARLVLQADVSGFNKGIDTAKGKTKELGTATQAAGTQAAAGMAKAESGATKAATGFGAASKSMGQLRTQIGLMQSALTGFGILAFASQLQNVIDGYRAGFEMLTTDIGDEIHIKGQAAEAAHLATEWFYKTMEADIAKADKAAFSQSLVGLSQDIPLSLAIIPQMGPTQELADRMGALGAAAAEAFYAGLQFEGTPEDLLGDLLLAKTDQNIARFAEQIRTGMGDALAPESWGKGQTNQSVYDWLTGTYRPGIEAAMTDLANSSAVQNAAAQLWESLTGSPEGYETLLKGNMLDPLVGMLDPSTSDIGGALDLLKTQIAGVGETPISPEVNTGQIDVATVKTGGLGILLGALPNPALMATLNIGPAMAAIAVLRAAMASLPGIGGGGGGGTVNPRDIGGTTPGGFNPRTLTQLPAGGSTTRTPLALSGSSSRSVVGRGGSRPTVVNNITGVMPEDVERQTHRALRRIATEFGGAG